jgi:hypothetical protein
MTGARERDKKRKREMGGGDRKGGRELERERIPGNKSCKICCTLGIREEPPTSNTWSTSLGSIPPCTLSSALSTGATTLFE